VGGDERVVALTLTGPSEFGSAKAVGVIPRVEDLARHVAVTDDEDACPISNIFPILTISVEAPGFIAAYELAASTPSGWADGTKDEI
jgi:hypothetical protein